MRLGHALVHGYPAVDDRRVVAYLQGLDDIAAFTISRGDLI